ncbi:MAG: TetR/AcrR family transcriptional regulator [Spirochaetaceae bacterium]|nr:TetR/AcrR family transcriptional regulator [Spirochaetaceae bacterium]
MEEGKTRAQDRRPAKTKKAIRLALFELLDTKDLNKITITELTKTADISRKTFYIHYNKLDDVLLEAENELITAFVDGTEKLNFSNNQKFFFDLFYNLDKHFSDDLEYYKKLARSSYAKTFSDRLGDTLFNKLFLLLKPILDYRGEQLEYACIVIASSVFNVFMQWLRSDSPLEIVHISDFISTILFNGLKNHLIEAPLSM